MPRVDTLSDAEARVLDTVRAATEEAMRVRQSAINGDLRRELEDLYNYVVNAAVDAYGTDAHPVLENIEGQVQRLLW